MSDEKRKFKIKVEAPKKDDKDKKETKEFEIGVDPKKLEDKTEFEEKVVVDEREYTVTGKIEKGWFGDDIKEFKVTLDGDKLENSSFSAVQWRWGGPLAIGGILLVLITLFMWWWMSSSKENKEEEGL